MKSVVDHDAHDRYLATRAARLRADFTSRFPEGVTLSRDTWTIVAEWPH